MYRARHPERVPLPSTNCSARCAAVIIRRIRGVCMHIYTRYTRKHTERCTKRRCTEEDSLSEILARGKDDLDSRSRALATLCYEYTCGALARSHRLLFARAAVVVVEPSHLSSYTCGLSTWPSYCQPHRLPRDCPLAIPNKYTSLLGHRFSIALFAKP